VPLPLLLLDASGRIVKANPAQYRLLGYHAEELHGKDVWDVIAADEVEHSKQRLRDTLNGLNLGTPYRRRFKTKDDHCLICELSVHVIPTTFQDGPFVLYACVDVTMTVIEARSRGEVARWLEASFRSLSEASIVFDTLGHIRYLNHAAEQLLWWSESEASGAVAEELIPWTDLLSVDGTESSYDFRQGVAVGWSGSAVVTARGGITKRLHIRTEPVIDANGLVLGIVSCLRPF